MINLTETCVIYMYVSKTWTWTMKYTNMYDVVDSFRFNTAGPFLILRKVICFIYADGWSIIDA